LKTAGDALDQLLSIEHAQKLRRKKKTTQIIDSTIKSRQRLMNLLDIVRDTNEIEEEIN